MTKQKEMWGNCGREASFILQTHKVIRGEWR